MSIIPVLMYHSISDESQPISVSIDNFYKQMNLMVRLGFKSVNLKDIHNEEDKKKFVITFDDGYEDVYKNALPILKKLNLNATCFFVANQIGRHNIWDSKKSNYKKMQLMNEEQIYDWIEQGNELGSHSLDHLNLRNLDIQNKTNQIVLSKKVFKEKFNIDVKSFSYPYGIFDTDCVELIKKNYKFAVTTKRSRYKTNTFEETQIPRVPINSNTSISKFLIKVLTFYEDIKFKNYNI